jgi:hypothetical protein
MKRDSMMTATMSDQLIEKFLTTTAGSFGSLREQYLIRETLYSLMRLARSEQLMDIRNSVNRLIPASLRATPARRKKKRKASAECPLQAGLAFGKHH